MFIQIVRHTPLWVFTLLLALLVLGYKASRMRTTLRGRVAILPVAMILLSVHGVVSAFGYHLAAIVTWFGGLGLAILLNQQLLRLPRGAAYSAGTQSFTLLGSWIPLTLMLTVFFTNYAVAVALALHPALTGATPFVTGMCLIYGLLSGMFFANALTLWRLMQSSRSSA
jgi:Family of unknown function (DUF6622)